MQPTPKKKPFNAFLKKKYAAYTKKQKQLPRREALGNPLDGTGDVAKLPTCGPLLILSPTLKRWGPLDGRGDVAKLPTCGPLLILSPTLERLGPPRRQG